MSTQLTTPTQLPTIPPTSLFASALSSGNYLEPGRYGRAVEIRRRGWVAIHSRNDRRAEATVSGHYAVAIDIGNSLAVSCSCPDFSQRGQQTACKHLIALALELDSLPPSGAVVPAPVPDVTAETPTVPDDPAGDLPDFDAEEAQFRERVRSAIGTAIAALADLVEACLLAGEIPFLIGATGSGKTSAVRLVAVRNGWGFEEVTGSESFADADLLGLRTDRMEQPGILARSFQRARDGETVLCFFDEALRFSVRALDLLMRPVQVTPVSVARAMGIETAEPVRLVEAPLWGVEWAPVAHTHLVLAANPWGQTPDAALIRRVWPLPVSLADEVAACFDGRVADAIRASWRGVQQGELPLPIEYQALARARHPGDSAVLRAYLVRLGAVDKVAAEGFRTVIEGMGVKVA